MGSDEILSIIPARGGSKGIPRKNVRLLAGLPLVAHSIIQATASRYISRVVVSTDDEEIESVAKRFGAEVIKRPPEISGDTASSESALLHSLHHLKENESYEPKLVVFLQCTSPLTLAEDIDGTIDAVLRNHSDSGLAVTPFHYFLWKTDEKGDAVGINHDMRKRLLRQSSPPQFLEAGAVYVFKTAGFKEAKHRFFGKIAMHVIPKERLLEIDDPVDFRIAEILIRENDKINMRKKLPEPLEAVIFDFDGVFTDNRLIVFQDGREAVVCHRGDGMGLSKIKKLNIPILVISSEKNPVVSARCKKLGIECIDGIEEKLPTLQRWAQQEKIDLANAIYLGNDTNDLACMVAVGCGIAVSDAHPEVLNAAAVTLENVGGMGAIRELCDLIMANAVS